MSIEQATKFVSHLETDSQLRERFNAFLKKEGYHCTVSEVKKVEWDLMVALNEKKLPASEHWV